VVAEEKCVVMTTEVLVMSSGDNVVSSSSDDLLMQSAGDETCSHDDPRSQTLGTSAVARSLVAVLHRNHLMVEKQWKTNAQTHK